ncbi:hypothetical protein J4050_06120 [Winogradskyella sp. DF17]|uniref:Uncharacterized protein n=1 Tax=Winogradskyella pelagia TaxID=2819984 RepID=A0ABS3T0P9_9FLAO|nr:hypothetical protein [Winogradskyella sp. DF17]MBO3116313.1 hypothetical protein [Winogradskyella sp. DF17]
MKLLVYSLLVFVLFVLGYNYYEQFFLYSKSLLELENLSLDKRSITDKNNGAIVLGIVLATLPLFYLVIRKTTNLNSILGQGTSIFLIVVFGVLFWRLRIFGLNEEFRKLTDYVDSFQTVPNVEIEYLKFDIYVLMGFIVGALIAILLFRDKSKPLLGN